MSEAPVLAKGVWYPSGQLAELEAGTQAHLVWDVALASTGTSRGPGPRSSLLGVGWDMRGPNWGSGTLGALAGGGAPYATGQSQGTRHGALSAGEEGRRGGASAAAVLTWWTGPWDPWRGMGPWGCLAELGSGLLATPSKEHSSGGHRYKSFGGSWVPLVGGGAQVPSGLRWATGPQAPGE